MSSLHAFEVAIELAERRRDGARRALADTRSSCRAAQEQLEQLRDYAAQTEQRWGLHEGAQRAPEVMRHHNAFMGRLEHAIGLQTDVARRQDARVEHAQQALVAAELRVQSLRKVLARRRDEQARAQARREQKETDERASLRVRPWGQAPVVEE